MITECFIHESEPNSLTNFDVILTCTYVFHFIVNIVTNSIILFVIKKQTSLQNFHFICLGNLALTDICYALILPIAAFKVLVPDYRLNENVCGFYQVLPLIHQIVVVLTFLSLAINRIYADSSFQFAPNQDVKESVLVVMFLWTLAMLTCVPFIFPSIYNDLEFCHYTWPSNPILFIYQNIILFLPLIVTSIVIIPCLLLAKRRQNKRVLELGAKENGLDCRFESMLLLLWTIFFIIETVFCVMHMFYPHLFVKRLIRLAVEFFLWTSSSLKLLLFYKMDVNFKKAFLNTFSRALTV